MAIDGLIPWESRKLVPGIRARQCVIMSAKYRVEVDRILRHRLWTFSRTKDDRNYFDLSNISLEMPSPGCLNVERARFEDERQPYTAVVAAIQDHQDHQSAYTL